MPLFDCTIISALYIYQVISIIMNICKSDMYCDVGLGTVIKAVGSDA